ncbi:hypothetical protein [Mycobacterium canetti]|uniref:Uncharacterized protein n=1 Tax=Mycobacterium canetti TaxID=78331 RepID=A0ABV1M8T2_9MYCO|nr:hypothetical protein [Mycobacterium canetti]MBA2785358.1 hypothetical protein [Mycobacterium canetti]
MGDRRVDLLAAKDSEIRRSMGAVPVGAGCSQVATSWASDRCIRCRAAILSADCANLARACLPISEFPLGRG